MLELVVIFPGIMNLHLAQIDCVQYILICSRLLLPLQLNLSTNSEKKMRSAKATVCKAELDRSFISVRSSGFHPLCIFYFQGSFPEATQKRKTKLKLGQGQLDIEVTVTNLK